MQAAAFCRGADFVSAQQTTVSSGIADLLHGADIDEFVFEPCGYSMNGLQVGFHSHLGRHSGIDSPGCACKIAAYHNMPLQQVQCSESTTCSHILACSCKCLSKWSMGAHCTHASAEMVSVMLSTLAC